MKYNTFYTWLKRAEVVRILEERCGFPLDEDFINALECNSIDGVELGRRDVDTRRQINGKQRSPSRIIWYCNWLLNSIQSCIHNVWLPRGYNIWANRDMENSRLYYFGNDQLFKVEYNLLTKYHREMARVYWSSPYMKANIRSNL